MKKKWLTTFLALLAAVALVASGCGSSPTASQDDGGSSVTEDSDASTPDEPDESESEDSEGPVTEDGEDGAPAQCDIGELADDETELVVVNTDELDALLSELNSEGYACRAFSLQGVVDGGGVDELSEELTELVNDRYDRPLITADRPIEVFAAILTDLSFVAVQGALGGIDDVVDLARANGSTAQVIADFGFMNHWTFLPAVDPVIDGDVLDPGFASGTGPGILVVDSGFSDWASSFIDFAPADGETVSESECQNVSHGTFVASVVQTVNPDSSISGVGIPFRKATCVANLDETPKHRLTDDLAAAFSLYFGFLTYDPQVVNLSIGSNGRNGSPPVLMERILTVLEEIGDDLVAIVAAGGNTVDEPEIYPAAFDGQVIGIGALSEGGDWIRWDSSHAPQVQDKSQAPSWTDDFALGCNIVGYGTDTAWERVVWSGSSFAAAVASGLIDQLSPEDIQRQPSADLADLFEETADQLAIGSSPDQCS